ncbi:TPA: cysteine synthase family protein [Salmonella enterica subsp. enterica serovar Duisburg]|nr:cysteine synthase family protein [Salmonella enterica subsp. enterica serovar Duisburg]
METLKTSAQKTLLDLIGNTPVVNILNEEYPNADVRLKLEAFNPGGSIKDRVAYEIITDAECRGIIHPGDELVEATSGNTGIGIAWVGRLKGYKVTIITHDKISAEKLALLKFYGATVIIMPSDAPVGSDKHYVKIATEYASFLGRYFCNQFNNIVNINAHYKHTAPELWLQGGHEADIIVCGVGSGGTISGIRKYFREKGSAAKFIVADPIGSIYRSFFCEDNYVPQRWQVEGIGSDFIPGLLKKEVADDLISVSDSEAFETCKFIRYKYSIDVGLSTGTAISVAIHILKKNASLRIMIISPDSGERYLSKLNNFRG